MTRDKAAPPRARDGRGRRRRRPACEALEARRLLVTGDFSFDFDSAGVTTDAAGRVFVSYVDNSDIFAGQRSMIAVYDPIPGSQAIRRWEVQRNFFFSTPGSLVTLGPTSGASRMGLQQGDILNLLPDGQIYAVRPSIGVPYRFLSIRDLAIDNLNIWDVQFNRFSPFGGVILPRQNATYGDIAVHDGQILVTGFSNGFDFVLRIDLRPGFVSSARVILSSLGQTDSEQPSGIAINAQGVALTTLPFSREGALDAAVHVPVRFGIDFDRGGGDFPLAIASQADGTVLQVNSRGMTVDGLGNFLIATGQVGSVVGSQFVHKVIVIRSDFGAVGALAIHPRTTLNSKDVAVGPQGAVFLAYAEFGGGVVYSTDYVPPSAPPSQPGRFRLAASSLMVAESAGSVRVTVQRIDGSSGTVSVRYATADGTARAGSDYTARSGTLTFGPGVTSQSFDVPIAADAIAEGNETFTVTLSSPTGGATLGSPSVLTVTIMDGDGPSGGTPGGSYNYAFGVGSIAGTANDVAADLQGHYVVAGGYKGGPDFDPGPGQLFLPDSYTYTSGFLAKYSADGRVLWAAPFVGNNEVFVHRVAVDNAGNVLAALTYQGSVDLDPGPGTFTASTRGGNDVGDIAVVKLDPNGRFLWAATLSSATYDNPRKLAVDAAGNVYLAGLIGGTADFDPGPGRDDRTPANGAFSIFVWKLGPDGRKLWAYLPQRGPGDSPTIAVRPDGFVLLGAGNGEGLDVDPGPGVVTVAENAYLALLDPAGRLVWARGVGGAVGNPFNVATIDALAFDRAGQMVVSGVTYGTVDVDPGPGVFTLAGSRFSSKAYVLKLDAAGRFLWAGGLGGDGPDIDTGVYGVAVDRRGDVVVVGTLRGSADFDPGPGAATLTSAGSSASDAFVWRLDSAGRYASALRAGSPSHEGARGLVVGPDGAVTFVGVYSDPADFGPIRLGRNGAGSFFVAQLASPYRIARPGDFDGDGKADPAVFEPSTATFYLARSTQGNVALQFGKGTLFGGDPIPIPADYDGDGIVDPAVFEPSTSTFYIARSTLGNVAVQFGKGTLFGGSPVPIVADYDGDGRADPAVFEPSTSTFYLARSTLGNVAVQFGKGTLFGGRPVVVPADYDGDGVVDPAVFEPSTSTFYIARSTLGNVAIQFGKGTLFGGSPVPLPDDFDGDGKADPTVFEPSTSTFYIARSRDGNVARQFGKGTAFGGRPVPIPADYDGDGKADPAVFEPSTSTFYLARSMAGNVAIQFGKGTLFGGLPVVVPADYDGDGRVDPAVFEPSTSTFYLARSTAGNVARQFGTGTAFGGEPIPLPLPPVLGPSRRRRPY